MNTILDLDLDFFVWSVKHHPEEARLPESECRHLTLKAEVRTFLERRCHLSKDAKIRAEITMVFT
jgi:hypothetical protein